MLYTIKEFTTAQADLFAMARQIRHVVFIVGQNCPPDEEFDGLDDSCIHYLIYGNGKFANNEVLGCARRRYTDKGLKIERIAVLEQHRGYGAAAHLIETIIQSVNPLADYIYIHAQAHLVDYYQRFGFVPEGDLFEEANIKHYKMVLKG